MTMKLSGSVGKGGLNKKEGVILIQEALRNSKMRWRGKDDGTNSRALEQAICDFQLTQKLKASGRINTMDPMLAKLEPTLPSRLRPKTVTNKQSRGTRFYNPTGQSLRGIDRWGSGKFGASRDDGKRQHAGADYIASVGQHILSVASGRVTKLGYPYRNDLSYRYIEITTTSGFAIRHFYVSPAMDISVNSWVLGGAKIGTYQSLDEKYPDITEHVHVEIRKSGQLIDPTTLIP